MKHVADAMSALGLLLLSTACVSESRGYRPVQDVLRERVGTGVEWRRIDTDAKHDEKVQALLKAPLTPTSAVQLSLLTNFEVQAKLEALRAAQAKLMQSTTPKNPELEGSLGFHRKSSTRIELSATLELTNLLFLPSAYRAAEADFDAESLAVAGELVDFVFQTKRAFARAQAAAREAELLQEIVLGERAQVESAKALHAAGNLNDLDLLTFEAAAREAEVSLDLARQNASSLRDALTVQLGLWGRDVNYRMDPASAPQAQSPSVDHLVTRAFDRSLDLRLAKLRILGASQGLDVTRARGIVPKLHGGVNAQREENIWWAGPMLKLELPIFDHGQAETAAKESELYMQQRAYQSLGVKLRSNARTIGTRFLSARTTLTRYDQDLLPMRKKILKETQLHYNVMGVDVFQLLAAKSSETKAALARSEALANYELARIDVEQLLAGRLPPSSQPGD